jgi:hypothetical protein
VYMEGSDDLIIKNISIYLFVASVVVVYVL